MGQEGSMRESERQLSSELPITKWLFGLELFILFNFPYLHN